MAGTRYEFEARLFRWQARRDTWVFVRLPQDVSDDIRDQPHPPAGFGSVKVEVTVGDSRWSTSVFPESADGQYVVAVNKSVRRAEGLEIGDVARVAVETIL